MLLSDAYLVLKKLYGCKMCGDIDLQLQACVNCKQILCQTCEVKARRKDNRCPIKKCAKNQADLETKKCQIDTVCDYFDELEMKHDCPAQLIQQIRAQLQNKHVEVPKTVKMKFTFFEMLDHLSKDCPYKMYCASCDQHFQSEDEFKSHLKKECLKAVLWCDHCQTSMSRYNKLTHDPTRMIEMVQLIDKLQRDKDKLNVQIASIKQNHNKDLDGLRESF